MLEFQLKSKNKTLFINDNTIKQVFKLADRLSANERKNFYELFDPYSHGKLLSTRKVKILLSYFNQIISEDTTKGIVDIIVFLSQVKNNEEIYVIGD